MTHSSSLSTKKINKKTTTKKTNKKYPKNPPTQRLPELCINPIRWEKSHAGCLYFSLCKVEAGSGMRMWNPESEYVLAKKGELCVFVVLETAVISRSCTQTSGNTEGPRLLCWHKSWAHPPTDSPHSPSHTPVFNDYSASLLLHLWGKRLGKYSLIRCRGSFSVWEWDIHSQTGRHSLNFQEQSTPKVNLGKIRAEDPTFFISFQRGSTYKWDADQFAFSKGIHLLVKSTDFDSHHSAVHLWYYRSQWPALTFSICSPQQADRPFNRPSVTNSLPASSPFVGRFSRTCSWGQS